LVTVTFTLPVFIKVTVCAPLVVPTICAPKLSAAGVAVKMPAGAIPLPDIGMVCGVAEAASITVSAPLRAPVWLGVNTTVMEQLLAGAPPGAGGGVSVAPGQVVAVTAKSPDPSTRSTTKGVFPVL
jgi:hypothetical protein